MIFMFVIFCFILLIIIEFVLEKKYMQTDEYKRSLGGAAKLKNVPHNIEICNVGSGPSYMEYHMSILIRMDLILVLRHKILSMHLNCLNTLKQI